MSDDNVVSIKEFYNQDSRITIVEKAIVSIDRRFEQVDRRFEQIDKRFDKIDNEFKEIRKEMKYEFRWLFALICGLGAIMAHGFHWF